MIDEKYVEAARNIRKQYATISSELDNQQISVIKFREYIVEKCTELENLRTNDLSRVKTKEEAIEFLNKLVIKVKEIEKMESLTTDRVDFLNKQMENLQIEEKELTEVLVKKYPKLTLDQIKRELHSRL